MRLLLTTMYLFSDHPTGPGRFTWDLAREFSEAGHEVSVIASAVDAQVPEYEWRDGIHYLRYYLPPSSGVALLRYKKHFEEVRRLLKAYLPLPPDVIHGNDLLIYFAVMEFYRGHRQSFYSIHSPAVDELPIAWKAQGWKGYMKAMVGLPIIRRIEKHILENSAGIDAKSQYISDLIRKHYGADIANRISIIPGWVDTQRYHIVNDTTAIRREMGLPVNRPLLFVLRRLEARMGLENFLYALENVRRKGIDFFTVIGGTGSRLQSLMLLCNRLNLQSHVVFMGKVPEQKLPLAYGVCDVCVMPTAKLEGFGIPILEAMSCGKPVLVTPVGAMPEVVRLFEPEWVARSNHPSDLAEIIAAFLGNRLPSHPAGDIRGFVLESFSQECAYANYSKLLGLSRRKDQ